MVILKIFDSIFFPKNIIIFLLKDTIGLHRVENPSHTKAAISLHCYVPPFSECKGFDAQTGKARVCQISFCTKPTNEVTEK